MPDAYPDLQYLINGMQGQSTTDEWDIIVSYSLDKLNELLSGLWVQNSTTTNLKFDTPVKAFGQTHDVNWNVTLGSPTLQFVSGAIRASAILTMPLSGTFQIEGEHITKIPPKSYILTATIPLASVSATEGDSTGQNPTPSDQVISFNDNPSCKLHVVFEFGNKDAQYQLTYIGSSTPDVIYDQGLAPALTGWFSNPKNIKDIEYSLAIVANTPNAGPTYLTPESMAFSVYSSESGRVGCLSVYIKTKGSGYPPGHSTRSFVLPNKGLESSFPIPKGHTASIIIRSELFANKFLRDSLAAVKWGDDPAFSTITPQKVDSGISLSLTLKDKLSARGSSDDPLDQWDLNYSWTLPPLTMVILDGKVGWDLTFTHMFTYDITVGTPYVFTGGPGRGLYDLTVNETDLPLLVDQSTVTIKYGADKEFWKHTLIPKPNWRYSDTIAPEIKGAFNAITFPSFSSSMRLDYFATTNIFAPNMHLINIDTSQGVATPCDILLVGNVDMHPEMTYARYPHARVPANIRSAEQDAGGDVDDIRDVIADEQKRQDFVKRTNILRAVTVTKRGFQSSSYEIFINETTQPASLFHVASENYSDSSEVTVETELSSKSFKEFIAKASLSVDTPWVKVSTGLDLENTKSTSFSHKTIYTSSNKFYYHGIVQFKKEDLRAILKPEFVAEIRSIVDGSDDVLTKRKKLSDVFDRHGHIFRTKVHVGASLMGWGSTVVTTSQEEEKTKREMEASANVEVGKWGANGKGSLEDTTTEMTLADKKKVTLNLHANGGDSSQLTQQDAWIPTTHDYQNWVIIQVDEAVPITDILPEDLGQAVLYIYPHIIGSWVKSSFDGLKDVLKDNPEWRWVAKPPIQSSSDAGNKTRDKDPVQEYLLVRETYEDSGALGRMSTDLNSYDIGDKMNAFTLGADDWEHFTGLGAYVLDDSMTFPIEDADLRFARLRAIHKGLLIPGVIDGKVKFLPDADSAVHQVDSPVNKDGNKLGISTGHPALYVDAEPPRNITGVWVLGEHSISLGDPFA